MKIQLSQVSKFYGRTPALQEVSCQIEPGQLVAMLGPNGAGKSTLLRCLAGVVAPDSGQVLYDGEAFRRGRLDLRRRLHFLPDAPLVFGQMTLPQHLGLLFQLYEVPPDGREDLIIRLWRELDLLPLYRKPMLNFSRGQLYKAALSGLVALNPELWLLDEPFASGMDPHGLAAFRRYARAAVERGATVIYTTQIVEVAERFADVVCVLDHGELRAFAGLETLRHQAPPGASPAGVLERLLESLRSQDEG